GIVLRVLATAVRADVGAIARNTTCGHRPLRSGGVLRPAVHHSESALGHALFAHRAWRLFARAVSESGAPDEILVRTLVSDAPRQYHHESELCVRRSGITGMSLQHAMGALAQRRRVAHSRHL